MSGSARRWLTLAAVVLAILYGRCSLPTPPPPPGHAVWRVVSWNLRNFPVHAAADASQRHRDPPHVPDRIAAELTGMAPDIVALQEIRDAEALTGVLPAGFRWVVSDGGGQRGQRLVIGWRSSVLSRRGPVVEDPAVAMGGRLRPALAVRLVPRSGAAGLTVVAVHLKARPSGAPIRRAQWDHLARFVARLQVRGERVIVLGDFNVTGDTHQTGGPLAETRALANRLARAGLTPVEVGPCTAYWQGVRYDAWLEPTRLDLAFTTGFGHAAPIAGVGAHCRTHGCTAFPSPRQTPDPAVQSMSDHCPVFVDLPRR